MTHSQIAIACLLALASILPSQSRTAESPASKGRAGIRLVYELPVDALQRSMQRDPSTTVEKLLEAAIQIVRERIADLERQQRSKPGVREASVVRTGPTELTIVLAAGHPLVEDPAGMATVRSVIETVGTIEFRMLATADSEGVDFATERKRLLRWLREGGRKLLRNDLEALDDYRAANPRKLRWVAHVLKPTGKGINMRWHYSLHKTEKLADAAVPLYTDAEWNAGHVPIAMQKQKKPRLIELVAVDLVEQGFGGRDLDLNATEARIGPQTNRPEVHYRIVDKRAADFRNWSKKHIGRTSAVLLNGRLLSAPIFRSPISGRGVISGNFTEAEANALAIALKSGALPAKPKLVRQERAPAPAQRDK